MVRRVIAFFIGLLTGILLIAGVVAIVFFTVKVNKITKIAGFDASKNELTAEIADETFYGALKNADKVIEKIKGKTVDDVAKSVKEVNNLLTSLEDYEMYGVKIVDATALRATTLGELGNFDFSSIINKNGIDDVKVGALLGYEYDDAAGKWKNDEMMNAIEKALADKKLSELTGETLEKVIDDLKVVDVLGSDSNVMKLLPPDTTVGNIDSAIKTAINTKSIGDLMNAGFIDIAAENQTKLGALDVAKGKPAGYWKTLDCNALIDYILSAI